MDNGEAQSGYYISRQSSLSAGEFNTSQNSVSFKDKLLQFLKASNSETALPFSSAFPDPTLFPMTDLAKSLSNAAKKLNSSQNRLHMPPGNPELRRQIAQRYTRRGVHIGHQDIVITSGAMESLNLCLQAVTQPGDKVMVETPVFYGALQIIERLGLVPVEVFIDKHQGLDIEQMERVLTEHDIKACWLMSSFNNPTGLSLSDDKKSAIMELANQHDFYIVEDDAYGELQFADSSAPKSIKAFDSEDRVLSCSSFSKSLCPGYRLGWLINGRFNDEIQKIQLLSTLSTSAPIQAGLAHYLTYESYDNHLRKLRKELRLRYIAFRDYLLNVLPSNTVLSDPEGGYFIWMYLPKSLDMAELKQQMSEYEWPLAVTELFVPRQELSSEEALHGLRLNFSYSLTNERKNALLYLSKVIAKMSETVR
ncbi:transcriptional regulator [Vibrio sp. JCM 19236]|nr:transcriptional regulator [Vibrio sp. JCM 19236]